jgi:hypothetical protein
MVGLGPDAGRSALEAAARIAVTCLGWDEARVGRDMEAYRALADRHAPSGRV